MTSYIRTHAIILKKKDYFDNDRQITLYTKNYGKITAIAVGARKIKSKLSGELEPFCISDIYLVQAKNTKIIGAENIRRFSAVTSSLEKIRIIGFYFHVIDTLIKDGHPDAELYDFLKNMIEIVEEDKVGLSSALLKSFFQLRVLDMLGYRPEVASCVVCSGVITNGYNFFSPQKGGIVCVYCQKSPKDFPSSDNAVKVVKAFLALPVKDIPRLRLEDALIGEFRTIIDEFYEFRR